MADGYVMVSWTHTPENAEAAAAALRDVDVIAVENPLTGHRGEPNKFYTRLLSSSFSDQPADYQQIDRMIPPAPLLSLFDELKSTDKIVEAIDIAANDPNAAVVRDWRHKDQEIVERLTQGATSQQQEGFMLETLQADAAANNLRDSTMVQQLDDMRFRYPGKVIGVAAGGYHDIGPAVAAQTGLPVKQVYASNGMYSEVKPPQFFDPVREIVGMYRANPNATPDPLLLKRALLVYVTKALPLPARLQDASIEEGGQYFTKNVLPHMTDDEVAKALASFDSMNSSKIFRMKQLFGMHWAVSMKMAEKLYNR